MHTLVARLLVLHKAKLISDRLLAQAHHAFEGPTSPPALSGFEGLAEKDTYTACAAFAMIDGRGCKRLHSEFLEQSFGNQTYHEHYNPPKPGNVNHILPAFHTQVNISRHGLGRSHQRQLRSSENHARVDEAGFHGDDVDLTGVKPVAQALKISGQSTLG